MLNKVVEFFSQNPKVTAICAIITILSWPFAIYTYSDSIKEAELFYEVKANRTSVFNADDAGKLTVYFEGKELKEDVNSVQISIWNEGKIPIRYSNILERIQVLVANSRVLDAKFNHVTRSLCAPSIETSSFSHGAVGVSWKILEEDDGFRLQITYAGPEDAKVSLSGIVEGKKPIRTLSKPSFWIIIPISLIAAILLALTCLTVFILLDKFSLNIYENYLKKMSFMTKNQLVASAFSKIMYAVTTMASFYILIHVVVVVIKFAIHLSWIKAPENL